MNALSRFGPPFGRLLIAPIFVLSGLSKVFSFGEAQQYMAGHDVPWTGLFLVGAIAVELGGGAALLLGWQTRYAALLLALYLVPVTLVFHPFWAFTGMEAQTQLVSFFKNLAIIGGLAHVAIIGAGAAGVDRRRLRRAGRMEEAPA